ncbi:hypothetical protein GX50_02619 [[Emmonsia] crescens]|uniref:Uncharacterized protein n=1 Tax=[Emmonsia] crescens TaxID=73230 RepID=A0A2B7ZKP6_9EURO|nr:hypothetical protein GX50_02619 [Emmonsia crescens]
MNWTGGRLQRHSYKSHKSLKASQKQYFAKARLKAQKELRQGPSSSSARSLLPQSLLTQLFPQQEREIIDSYIERERRTDETLSSDRSSKRSLETEESQSFEQLRRKLLKRKDWANLSIARPLRISMFPRSDRHTANIAKRRHRRQQEMKNRIPSQEEEEDADIAIGAMMDFPSGHLTQNGPEADISDFGYTEWDDVYVEIQKIRTPVKNNNSLSDGENLHLEEGFETDMETTRIANSRNLDRITGSSRVNGFYTSYHRERKDAEISAVVGANRWISSPDRRSRYSSSPVRPIDIQQRSPGDNLTDQLPPDYWSVVGSESPGPSQDPSESMLLDYEEMHLVVPIETESRNNVPYRPRATQANGERDKKYHRRAGRSLPMSDIPRQPNIFDQSDVNRSASSAVPPRNPNNTEVVHPQAHRYMDQGSSNAGDSQNSAHSQAPTSTNDPSLPPPDLQARYYAHPERFPDHSLRYQVPNPYVAHDMSAASSVRSASEFDSFDGPPVSGNRSELSYAVNQSTRGQSISASLELHDYPSSPNRGESRERDQSAQGETRDQEQRFSRQPTSSDIADAARPEIHVPTSRNVDDINGATDMDGEDYLWKNFIFRPATGNNSQETNNYYTFPSPARMEGSDLATADGPPYPNSLTEPNDASNETVSHVEGTEATAVLNSAEAGRSDSTACEPSSQNSAVGSTSDSSAHHNNISEFDNTLNETPASKEIANDNEDASSEAQSVETRDIQTANIQFTWQNQKPVLADDVVDNFLPHFLEPDSAPSLEMIDRSGVTNMHIAPWLKAYIKRSR